MAMCSVKCGGHVVSSRGALERTDAVAAVVLEEESMPSRDRCRHGEHDPA